MEGYAEKNKKLLKEYLINNNKKAYDQLVETNLKLVYLVINRIANLNDIKNEDLIDEYFDVGCISLQKAIKSYDINRIDEINLSTYAIPVIKNDILRELKKKLENEKNTISIDEQIDDEDESLTLEGILQDEDDYFEEYLNKEYQNYKKNKIKEAFENLSEKERKIIELYYGFKDGKTYTCYRISQMLNINRYEVNRIIEKTNNKLREYLKEFKKDYGDIEQEKIVEYKENELLKRKIKFLNIIKEYDRSFLKNIFNKIDEEEKRIVFLYCGINLKKSCDIKEISRKIEMDEDSVEEIIKTSIDKILDLINKKINKKI